MTEPAAAPAQRLSFGGPLGAVVFMTVLPVLTVYLWAWVHLHDGALFVPDAAFLRALPLPSLEAALWLVGFFVLQLVLDVALPGRDYTGAPQRDGKRRTYRLNGLASLVVTIGILVALVATGVVRGSSALALLGPLLVTSIALAYAFAAFLYAHGLREPSPEAPHFRGAARLVYDYFIRTGLNPRVGSISRCSWSRRSG